MIVPVGGPAMQVIMTLTSYALTLVHAFKDAHTDDEAKAKAKNEADSIERGGRLVLNLYLAAHSHVAVCKNDASTNLERATSLAELDAAVEALEGDHA